MTTVANGNPNELRERGLDLLAEEIRRHHKAVARHARSMLAEAIVAGEKLIEAKELLRHGEFGPWLTYCGVNRRTASLYMKLAREKSNVAVLDADSIRGALAALAKPRRPKRREFVFNPVGPEPGGWQDDAWREAMAAEGRHEVFSYYVPSGNEGRLRRCLATVGSAARNKAAAAT
jgi:Protein of unknown function (DUF3102)